MNEPIRTHEWYATDPGTFQKMKKDALYAFAQRGILSRVHMHELGAHCTDACEDVP